MNVSQMRRDPDWPWRTKPARPTVPVSGAFATVRFRCDNRRYSKPQVGWDAALRGRSALIVMAAEGAPSTPSAGLSTAGRGWPACADHDEKGVPSSRLNLPAVCCSASPKNR